MAHPPTDHRLPPLLLARVVGAALVALAVLVLVATLLVTLAGWSPDVVVVVAAVGVAALLTLGWWLRSRAYALRLDADGYRVGLVAGVGVRAASWTQVTDLGTTTIGGIPLVVLTLDDGTTTSLPVTAVDGDPDALVRELRSRVRTGHGRRVLGEDPDAR